MTPTIGRIVRFFPGANLTFAGNSTPDEGIAAVVVRVWSDTCVNLRLLTDGPDVPWSTSVQHVSVAPENSPSWDWPQREAA